MNIRRAEVRLITCLDFTQTEYCIQHYSLERVALSRRISPKYSNATCTISLRTTTWDIVGFLWFSENAIPIARFVGAYSFITWPEVSYLAEDSSGRVVGYVLSSMWVNVAHMYLRLIRSPPTESQMSNSLGCKSVMSTLYPYSEHIVG